MNSLQQHLSETLIKIRERIASLHIADMSNQDSYTKNVDLIEQSKQQLHHIVEQYFKDLFQIFTQLRRHYPSKDIQQLMIQQINQIFQELSVFQKKLDSKQFTQQDYEEFQRGQYLMQMHQFEKDVALLSGNTYAHHEPQQLPDIRVCNQVTESLKYGLNSYASVYLQKEKLVIDRSNYYQGPGVHVSFVNEKSLNVFDIVQQKVHVAALSVAVNDQSSSITLPTGDIFLCGGVNNSGEIQCTTQIVNLSTTDVEFKSDMNSKRVAHSLVYVPPLKAVPEGRMGYVYAIGGRVHHNFRTKLCERFNLATGKWEAVQKMNDARARAGINIYIQACAYVPEQHSLYVFFGTDSNQLNVVSCERYDLLSGQWNQFNISNYISGFEMTWGSAISVNEEQILLFGGLKDSQYFNNSYFNRKLLLYNITTDSVTVIDSQLPVDILPLYALIHGNVIYTVGRFMSCVQAVPNQALSENAFVVEISQTHSVCAVLG